MNEYTNASVAARPTPSAPGSEWNPRWQLISAIAAPKKKLLKTPVNRSSPPDDSSRECSNSANESTRRMLGADHGAADDPHEVGHERQQRDQQQAGEEPGDDQVVDRVGAACRAGRRSVR